LGGSKNGAWSWFKLGPVFVRQGESELSILGVNGKNAVDELVLESSEPSYASRSTTAGSLSWSELSPDSYLLQSRPPAGDFVVFSDSYDQSWKMTEGTKSTDSMLAFWSMNAFQASNASGQIRVSYEPGLRGPVNDASSIVPIALIAAAFSLSSFRKRAKRKKGNSKKLQ
jgi:hypothetical protein